MIHIQHEIFKNNLDALTDSMLRKRPSVQTILGSSQFKVEASNHIYLKYQFGKYEKHVNKVFRDHFHISGNEKHFAAMYCQRYEERDNFAVNHKMKGHMLWNIMKDPSRSSINISDKEKKIYEDTQTSD
eukprot:379572_1